MTKRKTLFILALAAGFVMACSLTNLPTSGAAVLKTPTGTPTAADTPEAIATPTQAGQRCTVDTGTADGRLNLRACAGTACGVVDVLEEGQALTVISTADGWHSVQTEAGAAGFVNSQYCNLLQKKD